MSGSGSEFLAARHPLEGGINLTQIYFASRPKGLAKSRGASSLASLVSMLLEKDVAMRTNVDFSPLYRSSIDRPAADRGPKADCLRFATGEWPPSHAGTSKDRFPEAA